MNCSDGDTWLRVEDPSAVGAARRAATVIAEAVGFDEHECGRVALAVSEAASNLVKHAVAGKILIRSLAQPGGAVEVIAVDTGPGMADFARVMRDGYSTAGTLGVGLGGIARMASAYEVYSMPGRGTVMAMWFTADTAPPPDIQVSGLTRPIGEESVCGDAFAYVDSPGGTVAMLCDGLGHGELAAHASRQAVRTFRKHNDLSPAAIVERVHSALAGTRGGAVAVAALDRGSGTVFYAGLGNVAGWIVTPESRQGMISVPGIAGHQSRKVREYSYTAPPYSMIVMHSDGLTERWEPTAFPGLTARAPSVVAATLLRDAGTRRDDAAVLTVKVTP
ncbi:ATP-binding SpoIIE family protein phosphatase [Sinosporangium siamense]|uniref:Transcriptional regulator n=1 Tax=Sinosporangium siamense TaxID=1367973 RepID=A0A919RNA4_9ACTN|nr:ATP-binding SpoIIE family protein phosphatase [Sinosporangium siamense]GII96921.1 transcriptional regulator [Sinosporangium siamense]